MTRLLLIGGGRMGEALAGGLVSSGWNASDIAVVEKDPERRRQLGAQWKAMRLAGDLSEMDGTIGGAVIAVKPGDVAAVCTSLGSLDVDRVLSIAAGVRTAVMEVAIGRAAAVVRAMPNTPALVGEGAAAIAAGSNASDDDMAWAEEILGAVGEVVRVDEELIDAVTGLSGSGPAYVFLVAEALIEAGVSVGLSRDTSKRLAIQTLLGASRMLVESNLEAPALRANVTSPGGTTAEGIRVLEEAGVRQAFTDAVQAATRRSRELGG